MSGTTRFVCIHGHFYQPPRENPWLEAVEIQDSAAPFHDWNERICSECYATNGAARIVNNKNQITRIVNNYARISFNLGPTLLSWLKANAPRAYRKILAGESRSRKTYGGHSSAMAQVYNHIIMPLASERDRLTQIRWGIADYESHYGIKPEGMWLAETAADTRTLELLAQEGIRFTVLAPHQCKRIRALKDDSVWFDTPYASVDTTRPYIARFESGHSIAIFFYNGPNSRAIAFEGLLNSGENLATRIKTGFKDSSTAPQLTSVATDGESYGHHHRYGEMALAYAVNLLERDKTVRLANYASFLEQFPPEFECEIVENTSWSCAHGIERWRSDCGCNGGMQGWNQAWRAPLRKALDDLRDGIAPLTEQAGAELFHDVWSARDAYIHVILNRSPENVERFLGSHASHRLSEEERVTALRLMEMQRHAQLMYTSCGWFFDDISGIETVQIIAYAARVLQLCRRIFAEKAAPIQEAFLATMAKARSNNPEAGDGAEIYQACVKTKQLRLVQVAAHYAITSVFSSYPEEADLYCYRVRRISYDIYTSGRGRLALGRAHITRESTGQKDTYSFAVLHFGDQNITAAVKTYSDSDSAEFIVFQKQVADLVSLANFPEVIRLIDHYYGKADYSLTSLFTDEQRRIVKLILNSTMWDIESSLTSIYQDHASLLHFLSRAGLPKPHALTLAAGFAINAGLRRLLESDNIDTAQLRSYLAMAKSDQIPLDSTTLAYIADQRMKRAMVKLQASRGSLELLGNALALALTFSELPFETNLWQAQNIWYEILRAGVDKLTSLTAESRSQWTQSFRELATCLSIDWASIETIDSVKATAAD
jgi:alpha-amylase/alpha-mannosidase (GH57 family)